MNFLITLSLMLLIICSFNIENAEARNMNQLVDSFSKQMLVDISLGKIKGVRAVRKFSYNPQIDSGTGERDVWEYGSVSLGDRDYIYPADGVATIDSVSSSNAAETGMLMVEGLDINGLRVTQTITINGQTRVALTTPLWRVYRAANITPNSGADRSIGFLGVVYIYVNTALSGGVPVDTTKVMTIVNNGNNQTLMSHYTVPVNETAVSMGGSNRIIKKGTASVIMNAYIRTYGTPFRKINVGSLSTVGTSVGVEQRFVPGVFPGRSDIVITGDSDTNGVGVANSFYLLLFDNDIWNLN